MSLEIVLLMVTPISLEFSRQLNLLVMDLVSQPLQNDSLWAGVEVGLGTGIYPNNVLNVGLGTTTPFSSLLMSELPGSGTTDVRVKNRAPLRVKLDTTDVTVTGIITTANHRLNSSSGEILTGIITATNIVVGTALSTSSGKVGFGTDSPRRRRL